MADEQVRRVLVVDDEPDLRTVVGAAFESAGYEVVSAADGADGIVQAQLHRPDVVIMDIMMPRIDGLTALGHLRHQPDTADLPVLLLSAKASAADIAIGMRVGADDYVTKPFDVEDLLKRAGRIVQMAPDARPHRLVAVTAGAAGGPSRDELPESRRPGPPPPRPIGSTHPESDLVDRATALMTGLVVGAGLTLVVVVLGLLLAWQDVAPPLWVGLIAEVLAVAAGVAASQWSARVAAPASVAEVVADPLVAGPSSAAVDPPAAPVVTPPAMRVVSGTARICRSPAEAAQRLGLGDILVIADPTPAYNGVAPLLAGLVTERGGPSSHAAIMARDLGIPTVVDAAGACTTIADGQQIVLDPAEGTIRPG
jgi:CheY-like chemotaxis protein/phosphohistidine swiveling domain-containing protein